MSNAQQTRRIGICGIWIGALLAIFAAPMVTAGDGAIEINDAGAAFGDVTGTGADLPGYPVTLDLPGRYLLTGNLDLSSGNAISIQSDGVVLDLGGFRILGPESCSGPPGSISCPGGSDYAVEGAGFAAVVKNGTVSAFSGGGVLLGDESRVEDVRAVLNGGDGIAVGDRSMVLDNQALRNAGHGIVTGTDGLVRGNDTSGNTGLGLVLGPGTGFEKNVINENGLGPLSGGLELHSNICEASLTCSAVSELCDGVDNDGDGQIDEDYPTLGDSCGSSVGACTPGTVVCSFDEMGTECTGSEPQAETCDGIDNDCNGAVDDGNPDGGMACATGLQGVCAVGTTACNGGAIDCEQDQPASAETCDGLDNDCDGQTDEGFNFATDPNHCGGCNLQCAPAETCSAGTCTS